MPGESGQTEIFLVIVMTIASLLAAALTTGFLSYYREVAAKRELHDSLQRAAYAAAVAGSGWQAQSLSGHPEVDYAAANAEFGAVWPVDEGNPPVDGPVTAASRTFQAEQVGQTIALACPGEGSTQWTVPAPGVLATASAPVKWSVLGFPVEDLTVCAAGFAAPPWWGNNRNNEGWNL